MVRSVSAAALILSAGLATTAFAAQETTTKPPAEAAVKPPAAEAAAAPAKAEPGAVTAIMQAQAAANAPPPPAPPVAAPSVAVAVEALHPAVQPGLKPAFAPPPASIALAAAQPTAAAEPKADTTRDAAPIQVAAVTVPATVPQPLRNLAPAPAPGASALVARRITDAAGAFDAWTEKAARIDGKFSDAKGVAGALVDATAFQAQQLEEGAVAYGALAALQDPIFVQSAKELASLGGDHAAAADVLLKNPSAVLTLPGADVAASFVADSLGKRAKAVLISGRAVKQAAYSVQANPWAKEAIGGADKRLGEAKARGLRPSSPWTARRPSP